MGTADLRKAFGQKLGNRGRCVGARLSRSTIEFDVELNDGRDVVVESFISDGDVVQQAMAAGATYAAEIDANVTGGASGCWGSIFGKR